MDYQVFEKRVLEILFKTADRVTAQLAAYKIGTSVEDARTMLERMAAHEIVTMETDDNGGIYFDLTHRPSPTGEPLSWMQPQRGLAAPPTGGMQMMVPVPRYHGPAPMLVPVSPMMVGYQEEKSVAASLALTFFFGPLGMFYSTVTGGIVMMTAGLFFCLITLGFGILLVWPACMLWAGLAANAHNGRVRMHRNYVAHAQMHHAQQMMMQRALPPGR
jgi:hypothetical protein